MIAQSSPGVKPKLTSLFFYLTWNCNLRCVHCCVDADEVEIKKEECTTDEIESFLDQTLSHPINSIKFSGGEPLSRWDKIVAIINKTKMFNISYSIETNGILLDKEKLSFLKEHKCTIHFSLNGVSSEEHDAFTGVKGSFDKAIKTLKMMKKMEYAPEEIITCIAPGDIDDISNRVNFLGKFGSNRIKINPIIPVGRGLEFSKNTGEFSVENYHSLTSKVDEIREVVGFEVYLHTSFCLRSFSAFKGGNVSRCGLVNILSFLPDASLSLCGYGGIDSSVVVDKWNATSDLKMIWETSQLLNNLREAQGKNLKGACSKCLHLQACQGDCRVLSYKKFGRWDMPMPICQEMWEANNFPKSRIRV